MKSVLFIGAGAPWLGGAGYLIRQRMFLRALAEVAALDLALFDMPAGAEIAPPDFVHTLTALPKVVRADHSALIRFAADLWCPVPRMFRGSRRRAAREIVAGLDPGKYDAIFSFRIDFAHFAGVLGQPRLLIDIDDPEHLRWQRRLAAITKDGGDWRTRYDLNKLARFEKQAVRGALASFVCQENDREAFDPPPLVVPNCVDVPPACPARAAHAPRIMLVGNFASASPNLDALRWFLKDVWPLIRQEQGDCEFHVVGRIGGEMEARVGETPGAVAAGFVDDLPAAMAQASLSIAPIRFGTGTRVKILESFALGCPVVSTTLGCEGIDARPGEEILIGDSAAEFARQCVLLLRDPAEQARVAAAGYALVAGRYNELGRRQELIATLAGLIDQPSRLIHREGTKGRRVGIECGSSEVSEIKVQNAKCKS